MPKIDFILDNLPDKPYNKNTDSNLYKYLSGVGSQLDDFVSQLDYIRDAKFINYASGSDLDKLGSLLNVNRFLNENDLTYRGRIKSTVPSFIGGGTVSAIRQVIENLLGVTPSIIEHYLPGQGHVRFDNGILNGFSIVNLTGLNIRIKSGTGYINGTRITSVDLDKSLSSNSTLYIKLNIDANISIDISSTLNSNQILIATITTTTTVNNITDNRFILDPYEHYITNIASITIQMPYEFSQDKISFEDTKNIIINTKSAGIAVLMNIVGLYRETATIKDNGLKTDFLIGFSGIGSDSFIGGQ